MEIAVVKRDRANNTPFKKGQRVLVHSPHNDEVFIAVPLTGLDDSWHLHKSSFQIINPGHPLTYISLLTLKEKLWKQ